MTRENPAAAFVLKAEDELLLAQMPACLAAALRKVHEPCNYVSAALELNIPIGTVKSRVHRARAKVIRLRANAAEGR